MRPIVAITAVAACLGGTVFIIPEHMRVWVWSGLGICYLAVAMWGTCSMRSGIFGSAHVSGRNDKPWVTLSFDDGPDSVTTPRLLDLLAERKVHAAFFCIGERVQANTGIVKRIHAEGHTIGNHSFAHSPATNFFRTAHYKKDVMTCQDAIYTIIGVRPRYFRPPYGLMNHAVAPVVKSLGMEVVGWQCRGLDVRGCDAPRVVRRVLESVRHGGIILLHDGGRDPDTLIAIVDGILTGMRDRGMKAVSLDQLLAGSSY